MATAALRPTEWWVATLERRAARITHEPYDFGEPVVWRSELEHAAAIRFFNAAFRAEESGLAQAAELADEVATWDPVLAQSLRLYGAEEGWHRELLEQFLSHIGGSIRPMGRITRTFARWHASERRMESIVLINLMFETIGSTTYRLALGRVQQPAARHMLRILTRDEAFHVPLNVHFLRHVLTRGGTKVPRRLRLLSGALYFALVLLPLASRPKAREFDGLGVRELSRAYALALARLFTQEADLRLGPPAWVFKLLGLPADALLQTDELLSGDARSAERAAERDDVDVTAL